MAQNRGVMAPTLFNLYVCVWLLRGGWRGSVMWKVLGHRSSCLTMQHLFRRSMRNACKQLVKKAEYADDVVLLASTREAATRTYIDVAKAFGLTLSVQKAKFIVVWHGIMDKEMSIVLDEGKTEWVSKFPYIYLGSLIADNGRVHLEIKRRIVNASKTFGALRRV